MECLNTLPTPRHDPHGSEPEHGKERQTAACTETDGGASSHAEKTHRVTNLCDILAKKERERKRDADRIRVSNKGHLSLYHVDGSCVIIITHTYSTHILYMNHGTQSGQTDTEQEDFWCFPSFYVSGTSTDQSVWLKYPIINNKPILHGISF